MLETSQVQEKTWQNNKNIGYFSHDDLFWALHSYIDYENFRLGGKSGNWMKDMYENWLEVIKNGFYREFVVRYGNSKNIDIVLSMAEFVNKLEPLYKQFVKLVENWGDIIGIFQDACRNATFVDVLQILVKLNKYGKAMHVYVVKDREDSLFGMKIRRVEIRRMGNLGRTEKIFIAGFESCDFSVFSEITESGDLVEFIDSLKNRGGMFEQKKGSYHDAYRDEYDTLLTLYTGYLKYGSVDNYKRYCSYQYEVALIWLSDDYKDVVNVKGNVQFNALDLIRGVEISPNENHCFYDKSSPYCNRARIHVYKGTVELWVGRYCPEETLNILKLKFGFDKINVKVQRDIGYDAVDDNIDTIRIPAFVGSSVVLEYKINDPVVKSLVDDIVKVLEKVDSNYFPTIQYLNTEKLGDRYTFVFVTNGLKIRIGIVYIRGVGVPEVVFVVNKGKQTEPVKVKDLNKVKDFLNQIGLSLKGRNL